MRISTLLTLGVDTVQVKQTFSRGVNHNGPPPPPPRGPGPGPGQQQPQSWQVPGGNVYASQQSSHYQQNPSTLGGTHFGLGGVRPSSSTSSRVQEPPPRHAQQPQQPHSILPIPHIPLTRPTSPSTLASQPTCTSTKRLTLIPNIRLRLRLLLECSPRRCRRIVQ
ncbi:hypothetical protein BDP27DRAFT_971545 [Rhodocollybia butyracea]|uniref:Uncharacterized protein n=1 Tax=Rhodocollybia butyracea TaxID=206335 RepID=A0A9P5PP41_9AGAR|nr:hypothetical protein BDP27DRAFT_971545 [Rhodocollybia butyracea]